LQALLINRLSLLACGKAAYPVRPEVNNPRVNEPQAIASLSNIT
jgi:hypothetical protein